MARRRIIAGNWKMNMTPSEAVALCASHLSPCLPSQHPIRQAAGKRREEETQGIFTQP